MRIADIVMDDPIMMTKLMDRSVRKLPIAMGKPIIIDYGKGIEEINIEGYIRYGEKAQLIDGTTIDEFNSLKQKLEEICSNPKLQPVEITFDAEPNKVYEAIIKKYEFNLRYVMYRYRFVIWRVDKEAAWYFNITSMLEQ